MAGHTDRLAQAALDLFGMTNARFRPLGSERDRNFLVTPDSAPPAILKLVNESGAAASVSLQIAALRHLARSAPSLALPRVLPTPAGEGYVQFAEGTIAWLLAYLPGRMLSEAQSTPHTLRALGRASADLSRGLAGFAHPALDRSLSWDLTRAGACLGRLRHVADIPTRALAYAAIERLLVHLPLLHTLPQQAIHGDLNPYNVLIGPDAGVAGIIDFGDMHRGPRIAELGVALAYHMAAGVHALRALLHGARNVLELQAEEMALLPVLAAARLGMTIAIASDSARRQPQSAAYLLRNVPASVAGLEWLSANPDAAWAAMEGAS